MELEVGFATDVGRQRQRNEDSFAVHVPATGLEDTGSGSDDRLSLSGLMLVADGMGGERAGDRASQITAERLRDWFVDGTYREWPEATGPGGLEAALGRAIRAVSQEIYELGEGDPNIRGLGSTVVVGLLSQDRLVLGHVGDSRCYRLRGSTLELLTTDHSWVQRQVDAGVISAEAARSHPQRNILTRSLGDSLPPEVDIASYEVRHGDLYVLCSDGLTGGVSDGEILKMSLLGKTPQMLAESLVHLANEQDGSDNITCVVGRACEAGKTLLDSDMENRTTQQLMLDEEFYEDETRVDIPLPERNQAGADWKTWVSAAVLAVALGLLASWLVQHAQTDATQSSEERVGAPTAPPG
ncbi:MAG: protein phosphatase 2C domain-containing protein [Thermoanaerobaculia bacterium]|nr:protein phosphatase 2C domain-containing protein [Thermoanaerobaculia bacterium]